MGMSASFFDTVLEADLATAPDGRGVLVCKSGSGTNRKFSGRIVVAGEPEWASCYLNAEMVIRVAAESVRSEKMHGESGVDMPERRDFTADLLHSVADLVRDLALDADYDATLTDSDWQERLEAIRGLLNGVAYPPNGVSSNRGSVTVLAIDPGRR